VPTTHPDAPAIGADDVGESDAQPIAQISVAVESARLSQGREIIKMTSVGGSPARYEISVRSLRTKASEVRRILPRQILPAVKPWKS
jgi:hypothetical protein